MAEKRGASKQRVGQFKAELALAQKDAKMAKLRLAAAGEAESSETKKDLRTKLHQLKRRLKQVMSNIGDDDKVINKAQACQRVQQSLIHERQAAYAREELKKQQSDTGNEFDERHQDAADRIHQIEKQAYQAQFQEMKVQDDHHKYQGALGTMMQKLTNVVGAMKRNTYQKLVFSLKQKIQTSKGALSVAKQRRSSAESEQLDGAVRIAKELAHPSGKGEARRRKSKDPEPEPERKKPRQPSAVRAQIMQILEQPAS